MPLHLHHAPRTDLLADGLADLLATPVADPFAEEVVVVPAKGVERWLTQRLSHRLGAGPRGADGVCAGVRFLNPRSLVALLTGTERDDPWDPDRLVWPLLEVIDEHLGEPWCATLARHLGHDADGRQAELRQDRRYSVARRLAGLFASYAEQRPQVLTDWRAGRDTDGAGGDLPGDLRWQAELWRRLVDAVEAPPPDLRHASVVEAIRGGAPLALPDRLSMFGHTRLPATELDLLAALGAVREVHLWLPQASPAAWAGLAEEAARGPMRRRADHSGQLLRHPLLSSLGRDSRELQRSLAALGEVTAHAVASSERPVGTTGAAVPDGEPRLLARLQRQLLVDEPPVGAGAPPLCADDRSVQVHACHGTTRQVEVLREVLVGLMEDDPTLEPRDILVMCPDVEAYAPLFSAGFGLGTGADAGVPADRLHPAHRLRLRLADRGLASTNPLLAMAQSLVTLAAGRGTASEVLDLAGSAPVRHRFGWSDDDVATVTSWVATSGVRWGLTAALRAPFHLADLPANTWEAGLDRILLGVALPEDEGCALGPCLPLDDVGSTSVGLAGALAELVARLERRVVALQGATTLEAWVRLLREGVLELGSVPPGDRWQVTQFERELDGLLDQAGGSDQTRLRLADVRRLLEQRLAPRPTRANFRTGNLTVSTLVPMRSVPHRVICLVGLDDTSFPRNPVTDGDDVLARDPMTGERDPRSEDRQLLLDAVLAAREHLVVTYSGADELSGQPRPPAVPLGELLDAVAATAPRALDQVVVHHPLQPFDVRNYVPGALTGRSPFSFDRVGLAGARAGAAPREAPARLLDRPLAARTDADVGLADLRSFLVHPVRGFLRQRLDVGLPQDHVEIDDALPVALDSLDRWAVGDRVLRRILAGDDPTHVCLAEQLRGDLPPDGLGRRELRDVVERAQALLVASAPHRVGEPTSLDVTVDLDGGRRLTGVVRDVRADTVVRVVYSRLAPKHRMEAWVDLLALTAAEPSRPWTAVTVGWGEGNQAYLSRLGPVPDAARERLADLVDVRDRGLREPLPVPVKTGHAWAKAVRAAWDHEKQARAEWEGNDRVPGECEDAAHLRVYGRGAPFTGLLEQPRADERWNSETSRLGQYALRLWAPLLDHEQLGRAR